MTDLNTYYKFDMSKCPSGWVEIDYVAGKVSWDGDRVNLIRITQKEFYKDPRNRWQRFWSWIKPWLQRLDWAHV